MFCVNIEALLISTIELIAARSYYEISQFFLVDPAFIGMEYKDNFVYLHKRNFL